MSSKTASSTFSLDQERLGDGRSLVVVHGAVDLFAAPELKRRLVEAADRGTSTIILDLSEAEFLDSTALGALLTAHRRLSARDGRLVVIPGAPQVSRVFEITGLDSIFSFAATRTEAIAGAA